MNVPTAEEWLAAICLDVIESNEQRRQELHDGGPPGGYGPLFAGAREYGDSEEVE